MLEMEVIGLAQSEWALPDVSKPETNFMFLFFVNYRKIHELIACNSYLILRMDEFIDSLEEIKTFLGWKHTVATGKSNLPKGERDITAFASHHGFSQSFERLLI